MLPLCVHVSAASGGKVMKSLVGFVAMFMALSAWAQTWLPDVKHMVKPEYPMELRRMGLTGMVQVKVDVNADGTVVGKYSNSESMNLWQIPVCRFTSEDGLRREGNNLFAATKDSGTMEMGVAGTENYGKINAYNIENSNVDMSQEMVNMIVNQRGFQSNSKVVTTADQMLQKAMELKRS